MRSRIARNKPTYLGYVVALGIAPAEAVPTHLRNATWQCLDGVANRMYSMPFDGSMDASTDPADDVNATTDVERVMWQYSWRESEDNARLVAKAGGVACAARQTSSDTVAVPRSVARNLIDTSRAFASRQRAPSDA